MEIAQIYFKKSKDDDKDDTKKKYISDMNTLLGLNVKIISHFLNNT